MPIPPVEIDLSQNMPPAAAHVERKPSITVILGKDVKERIEHVGRGDRLPTVQLLLAQALVRELTKSFPLAIVEVSYDFERMSCLQAVEEIDASLMESRALPVIRAVLSNEGRYEWDGAPLATPARAIAYLLDRAQTDADLGHLLGPGTQAFRLLCEAEAGLTKSPLNDVLTRRGKDLSRGGRRYFTETEHARLRETRESKSHLDDEADEDAGGHDMTENT